MSKRAVLGCLGISALTLIAVSLLVALNWDAVSDSLDEQSRKAGATLFRLGEVMSIETELKREYETAFEVSYDSAETARVLIIVHETPRIPDSADPKDHAREIATFAVSKTKRHREIDLVTVRLGSTSTEPFSFAIADLLATPAQ